MIKTGLKNKYLEIFIKIQLTILIMFNFSGGIQ